MQALVTVAALLGRWAMLTGVALLAACGGGGGDGSDGGAVQPPPPPPPAGAASASRIAQISFDFDNNGSADALETASYDASGRQLSSSYRYTGDGTPDLLNLAGTAATSNGLAYDAQGRVSELQNESGGGRSVFAFAYGADGLASSATTTVNAAGQTYTGGISFAYTGGLATLLTQTLPGGMTSTTSYRYDTRGRRIAKEERMAGSPAAALTDYTWTPEDRLATVRMDIDSNSEEALYTLVYQDGRQTRSVKTVAGIVRYSVDFSYDARGRVQQARFDRLGDGSIDAVWTLSWEDAPCRDLRLPLWDPLIDSRTGLGFSLNGEVARCGN